MTPLYGGGTLLQSIDHVLGMDEVLARRWFRQILLGMGHIHGKVGRRSRAYGLFISLPPREITLRRMLLCAWHYILVPRWRWLLLLLLSDSVRWLPACSRRRRR